jgi:hypothetical protein
VLVRIQFFFLETSKFTNNFTAQEEEEDPPVEAVRRLITTSYGNLLNDLLNSHSRNACAAGECRQLFCVAMTGKTMMMMRSSGTAVDRRQQKGSHYLVNKEEHRQLFEFLV